MAVLEGSSVSAPVPGRGARVGGSIAVLVAVALLAGACSGPAYPPEGRAGFAPSPRSADAGAPSAVAREPLSGRAASSRVPPAGVERPAALPKTERWWPRWSDPANWVLDERYQL